MAIGASIWTTECSHPPPRAIDIVCLTYAPYSWLLILGFEVVVAWGIGILLLETLTPTRLGNYWKFHVSPTPKIALFLTTMSFGILGILSRWINGWPPFYPENFLQDYMPWLLGGALVGFLLGTLMNWDSLKRDR